MMIRKKVFCNTLAQQRGLDPAGYATELTRLVALETPLPWSAASVKHLPDSYQPIIQRILSAPDPELLLRQMRLSGMLLIAPEANRRRVGYCRIIVWERVADAFAHYTRTEYLLPEVELGAFGWALTFNPETMPLFEQYRTNADEGVRDFLVCTHGARDAACGTFGYPLYRSLKRCATDTARGRARVWRSSHFGGHEFAPTVIEFPAGIYWAYVGTEQAAQIVERTGDIARLHGHYRGWSGLARGFLQVAEREILLREGWGWFDYRRAGQIIAQNTASEASWADVRITFSSPDVQHQGAYTARVEVVGHIDTPYDTELHEHAEIASPRPPHPQYRVTKLQRVQEKGDQELCHHQNMS
ncbi:MAG: hypothetical protein MI924_18275 [Chloroflexales bacterium]|nr:hypothetical protein [Chloroflexales bacterium]